MTNTAHSTRARIIVLIEVPSNFSGAYVANGVNAYSGAPHGTLAGMAPGPAGWAFRAYGAIVGWGMGQAINATTPPELSAALNQMNIANAVAAAAAIGLGAPAIATALVSAGVGLAVSSALTYGYSNFDSHLLWFKPPPSGGKDFSPCQGLHLLCHAVKTQARLNVLTA